MIARQKASNNFYSWYVKPNMTQVDAAKFGSLNIMAIFKQNNRHTISPQSHIVFIMPLSKKGIGRCQKSGTGKNQGRRRTAPRNSRGFNCSDCHSKINKLSLPVISVSLPLNNSVINPPQISSVRQNSFSSSHKTPRDNQGFNSKEINSKRNELPSLVIPVPPPLNDSVINPHQLSSVFQQLSSSSHNTTHELKASSIPSQTSPDPSNPMPAPSTKNGSCSIYGCMVYVYKFTPAQWQQHAVILLQHYHKLCNTIDPSLIFVTPPPIPNIESLSQSAMSSLDSG